MKKNLGIITGWTDYPIATLGDIPNHPAPIRRVKVIGYDGDKYIDVEVLGEIGVTAQFKRGYLYSQPGRLGQVKAVNGDKLAHAFGFDTTARYYAKRGIKIKRSRHGGFYFVD